MEGQRRGQWGGRTSARMPSEFEEMAKHKLILNTSHQKMDHGLNLSHCLFSYKRSFIETQLALSFKP